MKKQLLQLSFICFLSILFLFSAKAQRLGDSGLQPHKPRIELNGVSVSEVYPNPAEQMAYFDYRVPTENRTVSLEIFNIIGEVVWKEELNRISGTAAVNLSSFKRGVYFYRLHVGQDKTSIKKLIVQ